MLTNQKVIYVPRFYEKSGVEEDRLRSGRHGAIGTSGSKTSVVPMEENSHMETEEVVEELNANLNAKRGWLQIWRWSPRSMGKQRLQWRILIAIIPH